MILTFPEVISVDEQKAILVEAAQADFVDGRETASPRLASIKNNQQIKRGSAPVQRVADVVLAALRRNPEFLNAVYPKQLHSMLVSRYREGMQYGAHVDQALMGDNTVWRTDLSLTLFLNEPDAYDGGELALQYGSGETLTKLPARSMVCYPTGQLHRVAPVTRGERLVVVGWIQSYVRDHAARETLRDLSQALELLREREEFRAAHDLINKTHTNLMRRWAEP
jgi:PKHD-type hydroxylase